MKMSNTDVPFRGLVQLPNLTPPIILVNELRQARIDSLVAEFSLSSTYNDRIFRSFSECDVSQVVRDELSAIISSAIQQHTIYHLKAKHVFLSEPLFFLRNDSTNRVHFGAYADSSHVAQIDDSEVLSYMHPHRKLTSITFVNDDFDGGEIVFPTVFNNADQPFKLKPISGVTLIFPSDVRFPYELMPVNKGASHAIIGWFEVQW